MPGNKAGKPSPAGQTGRSANRGATGFAGRADLLRLLNDLGQDALDGIAPLLGYHVKPAERQHARWVELNIEPLVQSVKKATPLPSATSLRPSYWALQRRESRSPEVASIQAPDWYQAADASGDDMQHDQRAGESLPAPRLQPLLPWSRLGPWLRQVLGNTRPGSMPDVDRLTRMISAGHPIRHLPFRVRRGWASQISLLLGHARHLGAYRDDINQVWQRLLRERGHSHLMVDVLETPDFHGRLMVRSATRRHALPRSWSPPAPGIPILILGDLGILADPDARAALPDWARFGRQWRAAGIQPHVLCPVPAGRIPGNLARDYAIHEWAPGARLAHRCAPSGESPVATDCRELDQLAAYLAPLLYAEPALVRALRTQLGMHPVLEADLQRYPQIHGDGTHLAWQGEADEAARQAAFSRLAPGEQKRLLVLIERFHGHRPSLAFTERGWVAHYLRELSVAQRRAVLSDAELAELEAYRARLVRHCHESADDSFLRTYWLSDHLQRQGAGLLAGSEKLAALWAIQKQSEFKQGLALPEWLPAQVDLRYFLNASNRPPQACRVVQRGNDLFLESVANRKAGGAVLAETTLQGDAVVLEVKGATQERRVFAASQLPLPLTTLPTEGEVWLDLGGEEIALQTLRPVWAKHMERSAEGLFADLEVDTAYGTALQRMCWIPPGSFLMGSPDSEAERAKNEGPQHRVTLTQGFWLADTACTQALWRAVMGDNPSRFRGDDLPVEQVSHQEVREFLSCLQDFLPGAVVDLPTEAEWEYACRAGADTPFHWGEMIDPKQANYGGTLSYASGKKGKYRVRTEPVKALAANAWGLYQMHGNVLEWCADGLRVYDRGAQADPVGPGRDDPGALRVARGGAWSSDDARGLRSACRLAIDSGIHSRSLGFRFALRSSQEARRA